MKKSLVVGIALALACASAAAEDFVPGFYAGVAVGEVTMEDTVLGADLEGSDTAFKLLGGYSFNQYFSLEAAYIDGGNPEDTVFGITVDSDATALQASAIGTIPVNDRFAVYLRGSLLSWEAETTATDGFDFVTADTDGTDFGYGIGVAFGVTNNFRLRGEFEAADLDGTDLTLLSISGVFSF